MSDSEQVWIEMAGRVIRTVLARKGIGYTHLSIGLTKLGISDDEKALAARVSRGRISLAMFLQVAQVANAKLPALWGLNQNGQDSFELKASHVMCAELSRHPTVTISDLARRIQRIGANHSEKTLVARISAGSLSLATFLQCLVALGSTSLEPFVDYEDLVSAAQTCYCKSDEETENPVNS